MPNASIPATTPTTIAGTFDCWAFAIQSFGYGLVPYGAPAGTAPSRITFVARGVKFRNRPDGLQEQSPLATDTNTLTVPDLYAAAATRPYMASALQGMIAAIEQYGIETGQL